MAPLRFERWTPQRVGEGHALSRQLSSEIRRRDALWSVSDAFRLVDDVGGGHGPLAGVKVERFGDWGVLETYDRDAYDRRNDVAAALVDQGARGVYLKVRERRGTPALDEQLAPPAPIAGEPAPEEFVVVEHDRAHIVSLGDGMSTGLFVDQRENRVRVSQLAGGRRALNLFCYTGSFTVAAAAGGVTDSVSVDLSSRALKRASRNLELNGLRGSHRMIREDALRWLPRAARRGERFGIVVVDPPSFARRGKDTFRVERDLESVIAQAAELLEPAGTMLAVVNHRRTPAEDLRHLVSRALDTARVEARDVSILPPALDCAPPEGSEPATKSVLVTLA